MTLKTAKALQQKTMEEVIDSLYDSVMCFEQSKTVTAQIKRILKENNLTEGELLRRNFDGVSEARYLVQKMIGELLSDGKPKV